MSEQLEQQSSQLGGAKGRFEKAQSSEDSVGNSRVQLEEALSQVDAPRCILCMFALQPMQDVRLCISVKYARETCKH